MAPHSSTLAWKSPWTEKPGRLQTMGSLRVGHDWATSLSLFTFIHWRREWQPTPLFLPGESRGQSLVGCRMGLHRVRHNLAQHSNSCKGRQYSNMNIKTSFHYKLYRILPLRFLSSVQFNSVQSLSRVWLFATPWIAARRASLSITNSRSSLKLTVNKDIDLICTINYPDLFDTVCQI